MGSFLRDVKIRWKLLAVVLPLVLGPMALAAAAVGYLAKELAIEGVTRTSRDDLDHLAEFALDLLAAHHRQFEVYREDKKRVLRAELESVLDLAYRLVEAQARREAEGAVSRDAAQAEARRALKAVSVGDTGYLYAMTSAGVLTVHLALEGQDISGSRDEEGRAFIREMCARATAEPDRVHFIVYPWRNPDRGEATPRRKMVAYRYVPAWDWIVAAGAYLDEAYEDPAFERNAFEDLKRRIKEKRVGRTGYIYAMTTGGVLTVHPFQEGANILDARDHEGRAFIREMCRRKEGWIRYPWRNEGEPEARWKIVRYRYFEPWDWIVAVGSYEDEFYAEANLIEGRILVAVVSLVGLVGAVAVGLTFGVAGWITRPVRELTGAVREVERGRSDVRLDVRGGDELGELAAAFNRMLGELRRVRELEAELGRQGKLASLGVLASGVAHEINNPLGVILGYASHMERKLPPEDPNRRFVEEIRRESLRCRRIVQDLLQYVRVPRPARQAVDLHALLDEILDFAAHHIELGRVEVVRRWSPDVPPLRLDPDQMRQVALNLVLNAGAAMGGEGTLTVSTAVGEGDVEIRFEDTGPGIPEEIRDRIFEPFFTTKPRGTGLGLPITRQIVERHGGAIRIENREEGGARVVVRLPLDEGNG